MRLIDADALKETKWIADRGIKDGYEVVYMETIDTAPTIEAIPVEWISKRIGELIAHGHTLMASHFAEIISLWRDGKC